MNWNEEAATLLEFMYHSRIILSVGGSVWYMIRNLCCSHNWLSFGKFQDTERFLIHCERHFSSRLPPSGGIWKYAKAPSTKKSWRDSLPIYMLLSAVSVLVVAQSSSEIPEGLMNNPVYISSICGVSWSLLCCLFSKYSHNKLLWCFLTSGELGKLLVCSSLWWKFVRWNILSMRCKSL